MHPVMNIPETLDIVDYETIDTSTAAAALTASKILPPNGPARRAVLIQFQDAAHVVRYDAAVASVSDADFRTSSNAAYGHEYADGSFLILRGTNAMKRFRAILASGTGKMRVAYVG